MGAAPDVVCSAARTSSVGLQHKLAKRSSAGSYFHANDVHALWRGCLHNAALLRSSTERSRRSDGELDARQERSGAHVEATVSYTHLTLPTKRIV